jgi:hypothetical protein
MILFHLNRYFLLPRSVLVWYVSDGFVAYLQVRYHSRKRLAEQRPRVRGQFVRQSGQEDQAGQAADR